jgi:putative colanic acid biosynthesis glycosyltransferase
MTQQLRRVPLSLVTVTRNNIGGLTATLDSIKAQTTTQLSYEWVVIDGASTDGTLDLLRRSSPLVTKWTSGPDLGIYDAMNTAIERANGEYLLFLNAGDRLAHPQVLDQIHRELIRRPDRSVRLGRYELYAAQGCRPVLRRPRPPRYLLHGLPTSHQAILYPHEVFNHVRYDESYRICGDYALTAAIWRSGYPFSRIPITIASFTRDGVSSRSHRTLSAEAALVQREVLRLPAWERTLSRGLRWLNRMALHALRWLG